MSDKIYTLDEIKAIAQRFAWFASTKSIPELKVFCKTLLDSGC